LPVSWTENVGSAYFILEDESRGAPHDDLQYIRDEFFGYLRRLVDVVNELHKEEGA